MTIAEWTRHRWLLMSIAAFSFSLSHLFVDFQIGVFGASSSAGFPYPGHHPHRELGLRWPRFPGAVGEGPGSRRCRVAGRRERACSSRWSPSSKACWSSPVSPVLVRGAEGAGAATADTDQLDSQLVFGARTHRPNRPVSLEPGTTLGPYSVTAKIGEGGMGEVYRARDTTLDRDVAIKVLPPK